MKGLQEALRDREERHSRVEKHDISEEAAESNSAVFSRLRKGMRVRMECYRAFHDVSLAATVDSVNCVFGFLTANGEKIYFDDIYSIEITDIN